MNQIVNLPKTKRGQNTLNKILKSSEQLFYEKGYHGTSIVDITNVSDIALGTFYIYFKDKYSLYKYLLLTYSHDIRKAISEKTRKDHSRFEKEKIGLRAFLEYIKVNRHVYNIIWESLYIDKTLFFEYYEGFSQRYCKVLKEAQNNGEIIEVDADILSYILIGISNFIGLKYVMFNEYENEDLDYVVESIMEVLSHGIFKNHKQ